MSGRPIKFRVWMTEAKRLIQWDDLWHHLTVISPSSAVGNDREIWLPTLSVAMMSPPEKMIAEQFTGLKDRNGREIYEGDVVDIDLIHHQPGDVPWRSVVGWSETEYGFDLANPGYSHNQCLATWAGKIVVIGNVHENPEIDPRPGDSQVNNP